MRDVNEPLSPDQVKAFLILILDNGGAVRFSRHALIEMAKDSISQADVLRVVTMTTMISERKVTTAVTPNAWTQ